MIEILIKEKAGNFAENKDIARDLRTKEILPALAKDPTIEIVLNFEEVTGATQSFIHALISQPIRDYGDQVFLRLLFKNCTPNVQQIINTVSEYMAES